MSDEGSNLMPVNNGGLGLGVELDALLDILGLSSSSFTGAAAAIALPEQMRPRVVYDPQSPLLAEGDPQRPLSAEGGPQSQLLADGDPQSQLLADGDPQSPLSAEGCPQRPLLAEGGPQSQLLADGDPQSQLLADGDPQSPLSAEGCPQRPLLAEDDPQRPLLAESVPQSPLWFEVSSNGNDSSDANSDDGWSNEENYDDDSSSDEKAVDDGSSSEEVNDDGQSVTLVCASNLNDLNDVTDVNPNPNDFNDESNIADEDLGHLIYSDIDHGFIVEAEVKMEDEEYVSGAKECEEMQMEGDVQKRGEVQKHIVQQEELEKQDIHQEKDEELMEGVEQGAGEDQVEEQRQQQIDQEQNPGLCGNAEMRMEVEAQVAMTVQDQEVLKELMSLVQAFDMPVNQKPMPATVPEPEIKAESNVISSSNLNEDVYSQGSNEEVVSGSSRSFDNVDSEDSVETVIRLTSREAETGTEKETETVKETVSEKDIETETEKMIEPQGAGGGAIKKEKRDRFWYIKNIKTNTDTIYYIRRHDGKVNAGHILESRDWGSEYYVHYLGFNRRLDEWVPFKLISDNPYDLGGIVQPLPMSHPEAREQAQKLSENFNIENKLFVDDDRKMSPFPKRGSVEINRMQKSHHELKMRASEAAVEKEHKRITKVKYIDKVLFGTLEISTWYFSPYPDEFGKVPIIYVCEFCLKYMRKKESYEHHFYDCKKRAPPGDVVYRRGNLLIYEVIGKQQKLYCQLLCLMAKLFLDHKSLFYDMEPFDFYILCETDKQRKSHFLGYFAKDKQSPEFNLTCLLILPPHQRKGYGKLLIAFSYELSRKEGLIGSPEKPLSDMGIRGFHSYWGYTVLTLMKSRYNLKEVLDIAEISKLTGIAKSDIRTTLQSMNMMKYYCGKRGIKVTLQMINQKLKLPQFRRPKLTIDVNCIHWKKAKPSRLPRANLLDCPPPAAALVAAIPKHPLSSDEDAQLDGAYVIPNL